MAVVHIPVRRKTQVEIVSQLLAQLATLSGVAALIAVVINFGKLFGVVKDGDAPMWSAGLNLAALVLLFFAVHIFKIPNITGLDALATIIAQFGALVLQFLGQIGISRLTHFLLKGVPAVGASYGAREEGTKLGMPVVAKKK